MCQQISRMAFVGWSSSFKLKKFIFGKPCDTRTKFRSERVSFKLKYTELDLKKCFNEERLQVANAKTECLHLNGRQKLAQNRNCLKMHHDKRQQRWHKKMPLDKQNDRLCTDYFVNYKCLDSKSSWIHLNHVRVGFFYFVVSLATTETKPSTRFRANKRFICIMYNKLRWIIINFKSMGFDSFEWFA